MDTSLNTLRILVTDDFEPVRHRLAQMLGELPGVDIVGESGSVEEALAAIAALSPDVVTVDLNLPDGSGLDVLRHTLDQRPRPLFVVLTSYALLQYREEALRLGAIAFFDKALEFGQAVELIDALVKDAAREDSLPLPTFVHAMAQAGCR